MAKLKNPLLSLGAKGDLGKVFTFLRRRKQDIVERKPIPEDPRSLAQLSWRHMYLKVVALWHALTPAEQQEWESNARPHHLTGYQWFISQALRPNPGIYLPLQGGTMSGDIDMAKNHLLKLPAPADSQEALRLSEYTANIAPYLYNEGARAFHGPAQAIPHATFTALALNQEDYDNDTIHNLVVNNSRLTCKTAGKYIIIAQAQWAADAGGAGQRMVGIYFNGANWISLVQNDNVGTSGLNMLSSTVFHLAVNEYVECHVYQGSGGPLNVTGGYAWTPRFLMQRIGL